MIDAQGNIIHGQVHLPLPSSFLFSLAHPRIALILALLALFLDPPLRHQLLTISTELSDSADSADSSYEAGNSRGEGVNPDESLVSLCIPSRSLQVSSLSPPAPSPALLLAGA